MEKRKCCRMFLGVLYLFLSKINCAIKNNGSRYKQNYPIQLCFVNQNMTKIKNEWAPYKWSRSILQESVPDEGAHDSHLIFCCSGQQIQNSAGQSGHTGGRRSWVQWRRQRHTDDEDEDDDKNDDDSCDRTQWQWQQLWRSNVSIHQKQCQRQGTEPHNGKNISQVHRPWK